MTRGTIRSDEPYYGLVTRDGKSRRISSVIFRRKITEEQVACHTRENHDEFPS